MRVAPSRPRSVSSGAVPPPPSSIGVDVAETSVDATEISVATAADVDVPPPTTSDNSDI